MPKNNTGNPKKKNNKPITKLKNDEQALKIVFASSGTTNNTLDLINYLPNYQT